MNETTCDSPFEERAERVLAIVFRGIHNAPKITKTEGWWSCCAYPMATYDFNELTRLVLAAHKYAVRAAVQNGGPGRVKILLHSRNRESDQIYKRHPTIQQAIEEFERRD